MQFLDLSLPTIAANLALDEALLLAAEEAAEARGETPEWLRLWESPERAVILGRAGERAREVRLDACAAAGVPVYRRASGGGAVVIGPGCLMYAVVLSYERRPDLRMVDRAHAFVLETIAAALRPHVPGILRAGTSDLAFEQGGALRKCSGNSVRCRRTHLLYHGTLLYDFPLDAVAACLLPPPRQPDYRAARPHETFVANLGLPAARLREALQAAWGHPPAARDYPAALAAQLAREKYARGDWAPR